MHKLGIESLLPLIFFVVYFMSDILTATAAIIAFATVYWIWCKVRKKKMSKTQEYSIWALWLLGGMTLAFDNPIFIIWKPSVVFFTLSVVLVINTRIAEKLMLTQAFERIYDLDRRGWGWMQLSWATLFVFQGTMNLVVAYNFPEAFWVQYKLFGNFFIMLTYILLQSWVLRGKMVENPQF